MKRVAGKKSEETRTRILESALAVFRERGFEAATMREIALRAEVATGAAYYYFDSKDAIVLAFYDRAQLEMVPAISAQLDDCTSLEARLRAVISHKFSYFQPNRDLLAALTAHTNPRHPLSPFSLQNGPIRDADVGLFARAATESGVKLPARIRPHLPHLLWLYQMGLILYWVYDDSAGQRRTQLLLDKTLQMLLLVLRFANLPILLPMHRLAADLLEAVYSAGEATHAETKELVEKTPAGNGLRE